MKVLIAKWPTFKKKIMIYFNKEYEAAFNRVGIKKESDVENFCGQGTLISSSSCSYVWKQQLGNNYIYIKKYDYPYSFSYFLRPSKAYCEWNSYNFFQECNIPCAHVLCYAEKRILGRLCWAVIITLEIPNTIDLMKFFQEEKNIAATIRNEIIVELAKKIALLHQKHFYHHDFKPRNILYKHDSKKESLLYFIDCPRGKKYLWWKRKYMIKDLENMYRYAGKIWSKEEWQIFLQEYFQAIQINPKDKEAILHHKFKIK